MGKVFTNNLISKVKNKQRSYGTSTSGYKQYLGLPLDVIHQFPEFSISHNSPSKTQFLMYLVYLYRCGCQWTQTNGSQRVGNSRVGNYRAGMFRTDSNLNAGLLVALPGMERSVMVRKVVPVSVQIIRHHVDKILNISAQVISLSHLFLSMWHTQFSSCTFNKFCTL